MQLLNGHKVVNHLFPILKDKFANLPKDRSKNLVIIQIGDNAASNKFVELKIKKGESFGINVILKKYQSAIDNSSLQQEINLLNQDQSISGLMIQLPLPPHLDSEKLLDLVSPSKDVDGLNINNTKLFPAVVEAVLTMCREYQISFANKKVLIINNTKLVGKPLARVLKSQKAAVDIADKYTQNIKILSQSADILISATGVANLIDDSWIKDQAIVIDIGYPGDVNTSTIQNKASFISPVPGGIGPLTVHCLFENFYKLLA
jgi:methylenetetrahydrofolate dehydrogenase (NADP+)/methenyltetrahydrofolate cyclohydrolase